MNNPLLTKVVLPPHLVTTSAEPALVPAISSRDQLTAALYAAYGEQERDLVLFAAAREFYSQALQHRSARWLNLPVWREILNLVRAARAALISA